MKNRTTVALKKGWFVQHSYKQTVHNMLDSADVEYLKTLAPVDLENVIFREVEFITPFDENQRVELREYLHTNIDELRKYIRNLATNHSHEQISH
jgi:hypothetical protein